MSALIWLISFNLAQEPGTGRAPLSATQYTVTVSAHIIWTEYQIQKQKIKTLDWVRITATIFLFSWGLLGLYSGIKNDGKSRFLIFGGTGYLLDKVDDQKAVIRFKNIGLGFLCVLLAGGLLYVQLK